MDIPSEAEIYRQWLISCMIPKVLSSFPAMKPISIFGRTFAQITLDPAKQKALMMSRKSRRQSRARQGIANVFATLQQHLNDDQSVLWKGEFERFPKEFVL